MTKRIAIAATFLGVAAVSAVAQAPLQAPAPTAAAQCQRDAGALQQKKLSDLRKAGTAMSVAVTRPIVAEAKQLARDCAAKIDVASAPVAELTALTSLYLYTNDTAKAKQAVATALAKPGMSQSDRADAYLAGERLAIATFDPFEGINWDAERYVSMIDAMNDSLLPRKISAHQALLRRYEYADIDDGLRPHAQKLLDLVRVGLKTNSFPPQDPRVEAGPYVVMAEAYNSLARAAGDYLHPDSALMILDEAERVITPVVLAYSSGFAAQRAMYALVGTRATPIDGAWWINGADGASVKPGDGKVTLIQFTAHWCVPCKNSYPGFLRLSNRFAGKPFESVMSTYLYGYIGDKMNLTPEQEVAEDRDYYAGHYALPFKIAISPQPARNDTLTNDRRYAVNGIPQIVVVDRKGKIRATVVGWDKGNEQRLGDLIDKLLREK